MGIHLRGETPERLAAAFAGDGLDLTAARRLSARLLQDGRDDVAAVQGLRRTAADALARRGALDPLVVVDRQKSRVDPFVKYLLRAPDGRVFETVRIPLERPRWSVCISSQVGCAQACAFCETGRLGFTRNLEPWEMVEQVRLVRREGPERPVTGVVFQGQGEPLVNYDNVMRAAEVMRHPCGLQVRGDRITISTVGILPAMERYLEEGHPYRLILSLTSAFGDKRARLVPLGRAYDVPDLVDAARRLAARQRGPVQIAWVLMSGVNTGPEEARELGRLLRGAPARVSVIDVNDPTGEFRRATDAERSRFLSALAEAGIGFVRRYSGGPDIHAACGMLASRAAAAQ
jgi:23S rRNA (adenine2503-C2)-methyltransferase